MLLKSLLLFGALVGYFTAFSQTANFAGAPTVICVGQSVQFSDSSAGALTYLWTFPDGGAGQTSTIANPLITYNNPGVYDVTQIVYAGALSDTMVKPSYITVLDTDSAVLTSGAGSDSQELCTGTVLNTITYDVFGATGATFNPFPGFVTGSFTPNANGGTVSISGLPNPPGVYPYSFTTSGPSCTPITVNGNITVVDNNSLSVSAGPPNQQVCKDSTITNIVFNVNGSPTSVVATGLPPGVIGSWAGSTFTIAGAASTTGSYTYTITSSGGPCPQAQFSGSFSVDPNVQLTSAPSTTNQTLCVNAPLGNIVYSLGPTITGATVTGLPPGVTSTFNPGQFLITNTPTSPGVYNYVVTTSGGTCGSVQVSGTITVLALPTLTQDVPGMEIQTLCETSPITNITYTVGGSATGATATNLPAGLTGVYNAGTFTISGTPTQTGVFNFDVEATGSSCGMPLLSGTLTIDGVPQLNLVSAAGSDSQQVCVGSAMNPMIYFLTGTATSVSALNLPPGLSLTNQNDSSIVTGSPAPLGTYPFSLYTAGGACPADTVSCLITVGNPPFINLASAAGSDGQSLCDGSALDSIIYIVSGAADTAFATGLPAGATVVFSNDSLIITGNPTGLGLNSFSVFGSGALCADATLNGTINIADPQLLLVSPAASDTQTLCINSVIDQIVYVFSIGATGATAVNLPNGVTSAIQNDSLVIWGTVTTLGSFSFYVHTTGSGCDADTVFGLIDVQASGGLALVSGIGSNIQTVDENDPITTIVYVLSGGANSPVLTGLPTGVTSTVSGDSVIITGNPTTAGIYPYSISASGGTCPINPLGGSITVQQDTTVIVTPPTLDTLVYIPNLFSPNGDDFNDTWELFNVDQYEDIYVTIINREGVVVFQDFDYQNTWGGTHNGDPLPEATYYYIVELDDGEEIFKGAVSILRNDK